MRFALIVPVLALAAACATPCPPPVTGMTQVQFACEDGSDIVVNFSRGPDTAQILQEGYAQLTLPARIVGSGYRYAEEGAELRGRGSEVSWTRPGAAETLCRETPVKEPT
jgi:membrane-bound inhibitor of C-type lysozyme